MKHTKHLLVVIALLLFLPVKIYAEVIPQLKSDQAQAANGPDENGLDSHKHYVNKDGQLVHSPAKSKSGQIPVGASAQCGDGTYSFSQHHRGTCSHHGGVATWL